MTRAPSGCCVLNAELGERNLSPSYALTTGQLYELATFVKQPHNIVATKPLIQDLLPMYSPELIRILNWELKDGCSSAHIDVTNLPGWDKNIFDYLTLSQVSLVMSQSLYVTITSVLLSLYPSLRTLFTSRQSAALFYKLNYCAIAKYSFSAKRSLRIDQGQKPLELRTQLRHAKVFNKILNLKTSSDFAGVYYVDTHSVVIPTSMEE